VNNFGKLEPVELRAGWKNEPREFSTWLSQKENLDLLGDELGVDLELHQLEHGVGPFSADLACKESLSDRWVVIENQLERTDHSHLGQLITYAAGLEALTVVWIAKQIRDEHRAALDWLNEITESDVRFFALEIELWRIGESAAAPRFNVVAKPNDWSKTIEYRAKLDTTLSPLKASYLEFWTMFRERLSSTDGKLRLSRASPSQYLDIGLVPSTHIYCATTAQNNQVRVAVQFKGDDGIALFDAVLEQKVQIEAELGFSPIWDTKPGKQRAEVVMAKDDIDPLDRNSWDELANWFADMAITLHRVFLPKLQQIKSNQIFDKE